VWCSYGRCLGAKAGPLSDTQKASDLDEKRKRPIKKKKKGGCDTAMEKKESKDSHEVGGHNEASSRLSHFRKTTAIFGQQLRGRFVWEKGTNLVTPPPTQPKGEFGSWGTKRRRGGKRIKDIVRNTG